VAASPRFQLHQAFDHRRREDARRDAVGEALSAGDHSVHLRGPDVDLEPAGLDCLEDAIEARRQVDGQIRDVDAELFQAPDRPASSHARDQVAAGVRRQRLGKAEVRVKLGNDPLGHDQHGEQEREVRRDLEVVPADDLQELAECAPKRDLADAAAEIVRKESRQVLT
jgi:hypothetical protein